MKEIIENIVNWINRQKPIVWPLLIFVILTLIGYIVRDYRPLACDMAEYVNNPLRILNGEMPYRDFWLLFPPGEVYLPALIYKIFGTNTDTLRIVSILLSSFIPFAGFYFGRYLFGKNSQGIIVALLLYFTSVVSNYEGPDYIHLYLLFILIASYFIVRHIREDEKLRNVFLAGLMMGFAFVFKLYEVGGVFGGYLILLIIVSISRKKGLAEILKLSGAYIGGSLIIGVVLLAAMGGVSGKMINELIFESVKNGTSMNLPYFNDIGYVAESLKGDLSAIIDKGNVSSILYLVYHSIRFIVELGYYLIPFIAIFIFPYYILKNPNREYVYIAALLFIWGLMSFPKALGRSDIAHLAPSAAPFLLMLYYIAVKERNKINLKRFAIGIVYVMLLTISFPIFKIFSLKATPVEYVTTKGGNVPFRNIEDRKDLENTLQYIEKNTSIGDYIFVTPWDAAPIYALTGRRNPTYYDSLNDLIIRKDDDKQRKIINDLISHKTKLIIHNADWGYDNKHEQQFRTACSILQEFIETRCEQVAQFGFYSIYKIRTKNN